MFRTSFWIRKKNTFSFKITVLKHSNFEKEDNLYLFLWEMTSERYYNVSAPCPISGAEGGYYPKPLTITSHSPLDDSCDLMEESKQCVESNSIQT